MLDDIFENAGTITKTDLLLLLGFLLYIIGLAINIFLFNELRQSLSSPY